MMIWTAQVGKRSLIESTLSGAFFVMFTFLTQSDSLTKQGLQEKAKDQRVSPKAILSAFSRNLT